MSDRKGLAALLAASEAKKFDVVLVDDLSRLARDNYLMLSPMAELHFNGVRVVSVADGLDTGDEEAKLGIKIRGIAGVDAGGVARLSLAPRDVRRGVPQGAKSFREWGRPTMALSCC